MATPISSCAIAAHSKVCDGNRKSAICKFQSEVYFREANGGAPPANAFHWFADLSNMSHY